MLLKNNKNDLKIYIQVLPRQKKPSLLIGDELGSKKVAAFLSDEDADDFVEHMMKFLNAEVQHD